MFKANAILVKSYERKHFTNRSIQDMQFKMCNMLSIKCQRFTFIVSVIRVESIKISGAKSIIPLYVWHLNFDHPQLKQDFLYIGYQP